MRSTEYAYFKNMSNTETQLSRASSDQKQLQAGIVHIEKK